MTIARISPIKNNSSKVLMRRIFILTVLIFFIFCTVVSVWAQNVIIQVYDPQILLLRTNNLWQINFSGLGNDFGQPIKSDPEAYCLSLPSQTETKESENSGSSREVFKLLYNKPRIDEKAILRQEWEGAFGFDVWSPYYKYREMEKLVKNKFSVQIFKLKGEPRVEKGKIFYVFTAIF